ncbi:hypothetical protein VTK73DRAFT_5952 [Phialemonium thermophilum]|uniref:Uncharacterized protein n=1 Tax=Phialemonium thermophilum TaxID=223376 RepID=A0ABR3V076_9PEZI
MSRLFVRRGGGPHRRCTVSTPLPTQSASHGDAQQQATAPGPRSRPRGPQDGGGGRAEGSKGLHQLPTPEDEVSPRREPDRLPPLPALGPALYLRAARQCRLPARVDPDGRPV